MLGGCQGGGVLVGGNIGGGQLQGGWGQFQQLQGGNQFSGGVQFCLQQFVLVVLFNELLMDFDDDILF